MQVWPFLLILGGVPLIRCYAPKFYIAYSEESAKIFVEELNEKFAKDENRKRLADFEHQVNMTEENLKKQLHVEVEVSRNRKEAWKIANFYKWKYFSNYSLRRQFQKYSIMGDLPEEKRLELTKTISEMEHIYSTAQICRKDSKPWEECSLSLVPDITNIMASSRDPEELKHMWVKWRDAVGPKCRLLFKRYVDLSNEGARVNKFKDNSEYWLMGYEDPNFKYKVDMLWRQLKPLYQQLHAYVRIKLREKYGNIVSERGPIPVHLLGNMWAQSWSDIIDFTLPYPDIKHRMNLTEKLREQFYTVEKIYETANDFYKSINLTEMPGNFWRKSVFVKSPNVDMVCHAAAWDLYDGQDFRITHCAQVTEKDFITAHHEMGHIEYFIQYKNQPVQFREGANDGFHEAIGDLITLSVQSSKHLQRIGLYDDSAQDPKAILNNLFRLGMIQIAFLPFAYLTDLWRWEVFSGKTKFQNYNCKWWDLRERYQGVKPPVRRTENDFDPAAKYHIVANVPYLRYFVSTVLQYQFHKALCKIAGEYEENDPEKPLYNCDIYGNKKAGNLLKKMLAMGASRPWPDALKVITGQREMDASAILEYFKPLQRWLEAVNAKHNAFIGWESSELACSGDRILWPK